MTKTDGIHVLAIGAHADDVELGMGATLAKHAAAGQRAVICDLTEAELSSNGTVEGRREEAEAAARILGVSRVNLQYPDRGFGVSDAFIRPLVALIRKLKPRVVCAPYWEDRHPDHVTCSSLVTEAVFNAKIRKYDAEGLPAHTVSHLYYYYINGVGEASFVVPVSDVYEQKVEALVAYASQFSLQKNAVATPLNETNYMGMIRGRDQIWGQQIGTAYGEGFVTRTPVSRAYLID
ncbi:bacillithiol biosynthesis deacetylase BshB1 [Numidum massiliense]|uniref:bacillithiol biosynthesis deacetylase BshB1 n=1 Tax=Numidum massiliense TaxID=1522315 RepID=UPI0006D5B0DE|nr:bacillithiol biosynthesis deacetylase BshB1 [Numidum massiliense]